MLKRILVPTDFSPHSDAALDYACDLAKESRAKLHLLHVMGGKEGTNGAAERIRDRLEKLGASITAQNELVIDTIKDAMSGDPHRVIVQYATDNNVDLIVMGTHGRTGLAHLTMGSVAERVLREAPCPVLVTGRRAREQRVTLERAVNVLGDQFGDSLVGTRDGGVEQMQTLLENRLNVSATASARLLEQLEQREWLGWEEGPPGKWTIVDGIDFVESATRARSMSSSESPAIDLIQRAGKLRATDVHIDPVNDQQSKVRLRVDGKLEGYCRLDRGVAEHLINQLKTLSRLDIAEPFLPKEGHLGLPASLSDLEVRITVAPVATGEAVALRLFARDSIFLPLGELGLSEQALAVVSEMLRLGEGLVLVTGPTGSGKTTTVYSMLENLSAAEQNIVSIEDPIEFAVPFVRQMGVDDKHGVTMTKGLRTILRMDPDVVFLGEVRDHEAADIAMRAAGSGKYVFTTLHTRNVASTVTTLRDMRISDRSLAANLTGIINQRLVRRLCHACQKPVAVSPAEGERFRQADCAAPEEVYVPVGCDQCRGTGYRGRVGVFEVALVRNNIADAIAHGDSERHLEQLLRSAGMADLQTDGLQKAASGVTSLEEALGVHWLA